MWLGWPADKPQGTSCVCLPPQWLALQAHITTLFIYKHAGNLNSGPYTFTAHLSIPLLLNL